MKQVTNPLLFSQIFSMNEDFEVTLTDLRYAYCPRVNKCQIKMYNLVIKCLSEGMSYKEIYSIIDNLDIEEYRKLNEEEKEYVNMKIKSDMDCRKYNERKKKRSDK